MGRQRTGAAAGKRPREAECYRPYEGCTKGGGLSTGKADAREMLKERRATALTQFFAARLIFKSGEEADGTPVSQEVKETHKFAMETARCRHNQREESLVVVT